MKRRYKFVDGMVRKISSVEFKKVHQKKKYIKELETLISKLARCCSLTKREIVLYKRLK